MTVSKEHLPPHHLFKIISFFILYFWIWFLYSLKDCMSQLVGFFSFLLNQHFSFSLTLITQALCLSIHNPKVWKPYLHYALSAVLQKYRFKALVFPLLHVSSNVCVTTATGALQCLKISLLKKIRV